jgi:photosystem II stability/assembly factor-like uncharacterized protein
MKNHKSRRMQQNAKMKVLAFYGFLLVAACSFTRCGHPAATKSNNDPCSRSDAWEIIGPGGGGAMFFPAVSPFDADYAYVACDMTGSYVTCDGGRSWRMFSLHAPVRFFVFDPVDPDCVYANSNALFRSTDHGSTWDVVYPGPSGITGVVSRGDHAEEIIVTQDSTRRQVRAMAVDPDHSELLYAAVSENNAHAFYVSEDRGGEWTRERELDNDARNIFVDPSSPKENRTLYICGRNSITVRENGIWETNPGPPRVGTLTCYTGGFDRGKDRFIIYAISGRSYFNPGGDPSGIYYTEDGGRTWENRQDGLLRLGIENSETPEWRTVATSLSHPEVVYVSYSRLKVHEDTTCLGVARSEDYGQTWKLAWKDCRMPGGELYSDNYGKGWLDERFGPGWGENPFSIAVSPVDPDICYTTDFGRTIRTGDGGMTWEQAYTKRKDGAGWTTRGLDVTTGYNVVFDPFDSSHVFLAVTDIGLMESSDGGESWESATKDNGVPPSWVNTTYWLSFDPGVKGKAWAAMSEVHDLPRPKMWRRSGVSGYEGGVLLTEDAGKTWQVVSQDMGEAALTHVLVDPASDRASRTLYACAFGKGVYKSVDGGLTWSLKNTGIKGAEPFAWRITLNEPGGELFLVVCRRSDNGSMGTEYDGAVYRSADGAESWSEMSLPEGTNGPMSILVDRDDPERLLLSAWGRISAGAFSPDQGGGIFLSQDDGTTWKQTLGTDQHIHDISYDSRNKRYYACGFNGSAYHSEDRGASWIRIKGFNFKWGKRVEPDPGDPEKIFVITYGGGIWHGPALGDESAVEDIITPVLTKADNLR